MELITNDITKALTDFISTVGFPIVVAIAMYYQNTTLSTNYQKLTSQLQEKLDANTQVLERLVDKFDANNEKSDTK